ncbi:MAG: hypothetical protein CMG35_11955 [Candidatus Marinimicrobia bacterium]|jgi:hypothetical protein|nr:hypothetical protein [Candidatus Neomarinimicrobiota bacterium]MBO03345.1 hypothetical protein [Candidatus Neomarinimicrobiota bacterium]|tara:strand:- start:372 stop:1334 length:963 start_codon:yes stop_codon:yes gene_type:complete
MAGKYVSIPTGNYSLAVQDSGTITLDTGNQVGEVIVTGNLTVQGSSTTVTSQNLDVKDNIITLNKGETGAGITLDDSGLEMDRGTFTNVLFTFNENITWSDPVTDTTKTGGFVFKDANNALIGIRTNNINTGGGDLYLINSGTGTVSVTGTNNYELQVTDDDDLTNKKYVDDAITNAFGTVNISTIGQGNVGTQTAIAIADTDVTGQPSVVNFSIDGNINTRLFEDRLELPEVRIVGSILETTVSNTDLVISSPGTGVVQVDDTLHVRQAVSVPTQPADGNMLYMQTQSHGKSGVFFVNAQGTRDELISKNRSILFSMLF